MSQLRFDGHGNERGETRNSEKRYVPEEFVPVIDKKDYRKKSDEKISDKKETTLLARVCGRPLMA